MSSTTDSVVHGRIHTDNVIVYGRVYKTGTIGVKDIHDRVVYISPRKTPLLRVCHYKVVVISEQDHSLKVVTIGIVWTVIYIGN